MLQKQQDRLCRPIPWSYVFEGEAVPDYTSYTSVAEVTFAKGRGDSRNSTWCDIAVEDHKSKAYTTIRCPEIEGAEKGVWPLLVLLYVLRNSQKRLSCILCYRNICSSLHRQLTTDHGEQWPDISKPLLPRALHQLPPSPYHQAMVLQRLDWWQATAPPWHHPRCSSDLPLVWYSCITKTRWTIVYLHWLTVNSHQSKSSTSNRCKKIRC